MGRHSEGTHILKMSKSQLACTYAALILHDEGLAVSADNLKTLTNAANASVETYWPMMFEKALDGKDINDLLTTVSSGAGAAVAAGPATDGGAEEAKEEEKKESSSSEDDGGGGMGGMFDDY